jgi:hypothetical protein
VNGEIVNGEIVNGEIVNGELSIVNGLLKIEALKYQIEPVKS